MTVCRSSTSSSHARLRGRPYECALHRLVDAQRLGDVVADGGDRGADRLVSCSPRPPARPAGVLLGLYAPVDDFLEVRRREHASAKIKHHVRGHMGALAGPFPDRGLTKQALERG